MLRELDQFYITQPEPQRGLLLTLREHIKNYNEHITEEWKYKMPFFYYKGKPFCYIWKDRKTQQTLYWDRQGAFNRTPSFDTGQ